MLFLQEFQFKQSVFDCPVGADAAPSNLGALAGKMIDGNGFYNKGPMQNALGGVNDGVTMVVTGTNWNALPKIVNTALTAEKVFTFAGAASDAYTSGYYFNNIFLK